MLTLNYGFVVVKPSPVADSLEPKVGTVISSRNDEYPVGSRVMYTELKGFLSVDDGYTHIVATCDILAKGPADKDPPATEGVSDLPDPLD